MADCIFTWMQIEGALAFKEWWEIVKLLCKVGLHLLNGVANSCWPNEVLADLYNNCVEQLHASAQGSTQW